MEVRGLYRLQFRVEGGGCRGLGVERLLELRVFGLQVLERMAFGERTRENESALASS